MPAPKRDTTVTHHVNPTTGVRYIVARDITFGPRYQARVDSPRGVADMACIACGKSTSPTGKSDGVLISGGGDTIVHPDDDAAEQADGYGRGGYMGWFPVGTECIKIVPEEYRVTLDDPRFGDCGYRF